MKSRASSLLRFALFAAVLAGVFPVRAAQASLGDYIGKIDRVTDGYSNYAMGVAVDGDGNVYISDFISNSIDVHDQTGAWLRNIGEYGWGDGQFLNLWDVAVDSEQNILAIDQQAIQKFDRFGNFIAKSAFGGWAIDVDANGNVYTSRGRIIYRFDGNLNLTGQWEIDTTGFLYPERAGVSAFASDCSGKIYALVSGSYYDGSQIHVFNSAGAYLDRIILPMTLYYAYGLAVDCMGNIYTCQTRPLPKHINVFNSEGNLLGSWGEEADEWGEEGLPGYFSTPLNIALDNERKRLYVTDCWGKKVQIFGAVGYVGGNRPPVLAPIGSRSIAEGQLLEIILAASDPDGNALVFSAANLPPGAAFDPAAGRFSWIPGFDQAGIYADVEFAVTDNGSPIEVDAELVTITVGNVNRPPVVDPVGTFSVNEFQAVAFTVTASDPDGDGVVLYAGTLPIGAGFNDATGRFSWIPDASQTGNHTFTFYAVDDGVPPMTGETSVQIAVADVPPAEQADDLVDVVIADGLPQEVENAYLANLKKVSIFINDGNVNAAINQMEAFIKKVDQDLAQGLITLEDAAYYTAVANEIISDLMGP